jgi:hypothetical protein
MSAEDYDGLARAAEDYFFQEVATDFARAAEALRSCSAFLGGEAAGPAAELFARCLEALAASGLGAGERWLDDVAALRVEEFLVVMEAMRARFVHDHDLLYTAVDRYLEVSSPLSYLYRNFAKAGQVWPLFVPSAKILVRLGAAGVASSIAGLRDPRA